MDADNLTLIIVALIGSAAAILGVIRLWMQDQDKSARTGAAVEVLTTTEDGRVDTIEALVMDLVARMGRVERVLDASRARDGGAS